MEVPPHGPIQYNVVIWFLIKDTSYVTGKKQQDLQPQDILVHNSVNIPSVYNLSHTFSLLAELQARMSRSCRFCSFLPIA